MEEKRTLKDKYVYILVNDFPRLLRAGETVESIANITFSEDKLFADIQISVYQDFKKAADAIEKVI